MVRRNPDDHGITGLTQCSNKTFINSTNERGEFDWSRSVQGLIMGSFFWGYCLLQFPSGILASKYGSRCVLGIPLFLSSIITLFIPTLTRMYGYKMLITLRFFSGFFLGVTHPTVQALFGCWILPCERSKSIGISYSFAALGNLAAIGTAEPLCKLSYENGWPLVYYLYGLYKEDYKNNEIDLIWNIVFLGLIGLIISCFWVCLVTDTPHNNRFISMEEIEYIRESLQGQIDDCMIRKV